MLVSRLLEPSADDVFYHYCSTETFHAICERKTVRFSDINMMNDFQEARWSYRIFEQAATELLNSKTIAAQYPNLGRSFFDRIDAIIATQQMHSLPVISSFSKAPDVLSQWRAYADDGKGFAVGFRGLALKKMPVTLLNVEYMEPQQVLEMRAALLALYTLTEESGFAESFNRACSLLSFWKLGFKNSAFAEEQEVRCMHSLALSYESGRVRLVDEVEDKSADGHSKIEERPVPFRIVKGAFVAYVDIPFPVLEDGGPVIKDVWIGPRHPSGENNIALMMNGCGLRDYTLNHSKASYR